MSHLDTVIRILSATLQLGDRSRSMERNTPLMGSIPEFDSMAVVGVLTALEDHYGFAIEDDEISGEVFETVGSLVDFVSLKLEQ